METDIDRAPFLWIGGKGKMRSYLLPLIPYAKKYVEPFGGAANMLFARHRSDVELYNDIDPRLYNLFFCLANDKPFNLLRRRLIDTPYSKQEFLKANAILKKYSEKSPKAPDIACAWAFFVSQNQGFSGKGSTWGRAITSSSGGCTMTVAGWLSRLALLDTWYDRLKHVTVTNGDALNIIHYHDAEDAVFYLDPPYVLETRTKCVCYTSEPPLEYHQELVKMLLTLKGAAVLSGYQHDVYSPLVKAGWSVSLRETTCSAAGRTRASGLQGRGKLLAAQRRTEVVWRNKRAQALCAGAGGLFDEAPAKRENPFD